MAYNPFVRKQVNDPAVWTSEDHCCSCSPRECSNTTKLGECPAHAEWAADDDIIARYHP